MRFIGTLLIITTIIAMFGAGSSLYHQDNTINVYNITNRINWNSSLIPKIKDNITDITGMNLSQISIIRFQNIIYKGMDSVGYIIFETAKWGVEFGFNNPKYNYIYFAKTILYILIAILVIKLFFILPAIIALFYILIVGIKKEYLKIKNRRKNWKL